MTSLTRPANVIDSDPLGSHFVLPAIADAQSQTAFAVLPHAVRTAEGESWRAPGLPRVGAALRDLMAAQPSVTLAPAAQELLDRLDGLPATVEAVAAMCEHRPGVSGVIIATSPHPRVRAALRGLPDHRHDADLDRWWIPARAEPLRALAELLASEQLLAGTSEVQQELDRLEGQLLLSPGAVVDLPHRCVITIEHTPPDNPQLRLCRRCNPDLEQVLRELGLEVSRSLESWLITVESAGAAGLQELLRARPQLAGQREVLKALAQAAVAAGRLEDRERLSASAEGDVSIASLAAPLRPFQAAAVEYARRARRTFLADEPGLGKTVQALATLEAEHAFPALVVCPASLRLNWIAESRKWLPERSVGAFGGEWPPQVELSIVSYDLLHQLVEPASRRSPRALVLDESHFVKNPAARRSRAAHAVAAAMDGDALVLLLTGTPIINRPAELASQLQVLDRLDVVGGRRRLERVYGQGRELDVLNRRLRRSCFVRRKKSDVLQQLPSKQRVVLPVELDNQSEYDEVQQDIARWVSDQATADARFLASIETLEPDERAAAVRRRGAEASQRARRAEALVRLSKLSLVAARGKLDAASEWIRAFTEADEKLVVFCRHREIGAKLKLAHPSAALATGALDADARSREVARFQTDPECRLIICSLDAAGVGLTLTAASNVAFVEIAWSPAVHDQAEDRVHRIGQSSAVTAWYLLAAGTIDERIVAVVESKRRLITAASDGDVGQQGPAVDELLDWVAAQARDERTAAAEGCPLKRRSEIGAVCDEA
jgi:hypothetical protein